MTGIRDPIDFLPRLCSGNRINHFPANPKEENIELSLGLSLNGGYGLEQKRFVGKDNNNNNNNNNSTKLFRASSVTDIGNIPVDVELTLSSGITRTCSLPPEREVEWRKRKEMQSLRRSEAKRKRVEKMKSVVIVKGKTEEGGLKRSPPSVLSPAVRFSSQGSIGSQESGGSSGVSDLDSQPFSDRETSETNDQSKHNKVKCNLKSEHNKVKCNLKTNAEKQRAYNETMPCVSTKGDGPDGKRIQGFLYRYGKGEEVRIVCVCHGSFLTPAEFVKHGGGGDVDHPLKHIVVTSLLS